MTISTQILVCTYHYSVSLGKINHTLDVYLKELREAPEEVSGVKVSVS